MKKIGISIFLTAVVMLFVGNLVLACNVANYKYGSSPVTAYATTQGTKCDKGSGWNNYLKAHCYGYQVSSSGGNQREDGGVQQKWNSSSVTSRIWVNWGRGTYYYNTYACSCNHCGTVYGNETHSFTFAN